MAKRKKSAPDYRLTIRLTKDQRAKIRAGAREFKTTEGDYVRQLLTVRRPLKTRRKPTATGSAHPPASISGLDKAG